MVDDSAVVKELGQLLYILSTLDHEPALRDLLRREFQAELRQAKADGISLERVPEAAAMATAAANKAEEVPTPPAFPYFMAIRPCVAPTVR